MEMAKISKILGDKKSRINDEMDLIEISRKGVDKGALLHLAKYMGVTTQRMAEILPITERTIQRYKPGMHFSRTVSEQILHIAEVAARGSEVFGDREKFLQWMNLPSKALAGRTPMDLLETRFGAEMVLGELGRIEHGVLS